MYIRFAAIYVLPAEPSAILTCFCTVIVVDDATYLQANIDEVGFVFAGSLLDSVVKVVLPSEMRQPLVTVPVTVAALKVQSAIIMYKPGSVIVMDAPLIHVSVVVALTFSTLV